MRHLENEHPATAMQWDDLRFFLALAREGSLSSAATALGVNSSTVFRRLGVLESRVGARLLEKRGRCYVLTSMGASLMIHARQMEAEVHAIKRELRTSAQELTGNIRVVTTDAVAIRLLPPHLLSFRRAHPDITVDLLVDNRASADRVDVDFALYPGPPREEDGIRAQALCELSGSVYASRSYLDGRRQPSTYSDLNEHYFIGVDPSLVDLPYTRLLQGWIPETNIACRCNSLMTAVAAVEHGLGIAALPCFTVASSPSVLRLFDVDPVLQTTLWLVTHEETRQLARVRALLDHLTISLGSASSVPQLLEPGAQTWSSRCPGRREEDESCEEPQADTARARLHHRLR